jgi:uncharacterized protein YdeI (YjbR/CyaY-like superfamily)
MTRASVPQLLHVRSAKAWRSWLQRNHGRRDHVWLVFHKRHTGRPSVEYEDSVLEALCYGWVDSLVRRIDEERFARKFTPRKPDSNWSASNLKRYAKVAAESRLTPAGRAVGPKKGTRAIVPPAKRRGPMPSDIRAGLRADARAWERFSTLSTSHQRMYVWWIDEAKRTETRQRRLADAVRRLVRGEKPGLK